MRIDTIEYFLKYIKTEMMTEQPSHCKAVDLKILRLRYSKIFSNKTIKILLKVEALSTTIK